jgi:autoinducer 2-degrading protein
MIVTCVYIHVKADEISRFIAATTQNHRESVKEPGNLRFDLVQKSDDPCRFMLYEAYESENDAADHKTTPHYLIWRETVKDFMSEPREGVKYNILEPNDPAKW